MSGDTSMPDIEKYLASITEQNGSMDNSILNTTTSCDNDSSSDEVEIVKELKVSLENHQCDLCCEGTFLVNKLLQFGGVLNKDLKHACDICDKGFKTKSLLNKHKKMHEDGTLSEDSGIQNFTSLISAANDTSLDISSTTTPTTRKKRKPSYSVMCEICVKAFASERTLATHKRNMHSNVTFTCEVCDSKFSTFPMFRKHCKTHTSSQKLLTCPICKKQFLYKSSFKKHVCVLKV